MDERITDCRTHNQEENCLARSFVGMDTVAVERLLSEGLLPGYGYPDALKLNAEINARYIESPRGHFWVAERCGEIVGTIAIAELNRDTAQLRWLRVAPSCQTDRLVVHCLAKAASQYANELGFLKLMCFAPCDAQLDLSQYFHEMGFEFSRSLRRGGRNVLEFYLDLYQKPELKRTEKSGDKSEDQEQR